MSCPNTLSGKHVNKKIDLESKENKHNISIVANQCIACSLVDDLAYQQVLDNLSEWDRMNGEE